MQPQVGVYYFGLAHAQEQLDQLQFASLSYRQALLVDPSWPQAANETAWMLATDPEPAQRHGALAVLLARETCEATNYQQSDYLDTLGAAYAEIGRFADARVVAERALEILARDRSHPLWIKPVQNRLELYKKHQPFREEAKKKSKWETAG